MRIKRSAQKARQRRNRNRRLAASARRSFRCESLEPRVMLDGGGLDPLPIDPAPVLDPGAISGRVWVDTDGDRTYNGGEVGQGGVVVYSDLNFNGVLDATEPSVVTEFDDPVTDFDEGGLYTLSDLQPGWHNVRQVTPSGFEQTFPSLPDGFLPPPWGDPSVHVTFVDEGASVTDIDFGNTPILPASVSGVKWEDTNGNAERDPGELGLPGVIIFSDTNLNGVLDTDEPQTVTSEDDPTTDFDESGQYTLTNLEPGWHWIKEVVPDGYRQTYPAPWIPPFAPGDELFTTPPVGGRPHDVFLTSGQSVDGLDFGNQLIVPGSVNGVKWEDIDGDGVRGAGEPGIAGVTIYADLNFNGQLDADEPSTVTMTDIPETDFDEGGLYSLPIDPGSYYIREVVPEGFQQTFPNAVFPLPLPILPPIGILPPQDGAHYVTVGSGQAVENIEFGNQRIPLGSISGVKWNDANGNAERDPGEVGLAGVTIYADLNNNGQLDASEPSAITTADVPETDFDEGGRYTLSGLRSGDYVIREIVPDGFRQTFPIVGEVTPPPVDPASPSDQLGTVDPGRLDLTLAAGEISIQEFALTIDASIFVPIEIDVFAQSPDGTTIEFINISGPQTNGGSGDESVFQLMFIGSGVDFAGELAFYDTNPALFAPPVASIPLTVITGTPGDGAHRIWLDPGANLDGIDFGNQPIGPTTGNVAGRKWLDADGDREQGPGEPGLAGVTIYADLNRNGVLDGDEPSTVTMEDIPETDFDEAGLYSLEVDAGEHWIAEVVPDGFQQTFPANPVIAIFPPPPGAGVHFVTVAAGQTVNDLDFGNRRVVNGSVSGTAWDDVNGDGVHDPDEPGLANVTVYADYNFNGRLDIGEPSTTTIEDLTAVFPNNTGTYSLDVRPGFTAIRQIVPDGRFATFPISDAASPLEQGGHFVNVESEVNIPNLDFGSQSLDNFPSGVSGRAWEDLNADGQQDTDESGLAGVTIYVDENLNGIFDTGEPSAVTSADIPETDFDESGLYSIGDLRSGFNVIRQIVPDGFVQTYPVSIAASPLESGFHFVFLAPGEQADGLDFGSVRFGVPLPGDFNADGTVDHDDLSLWEEGYGGSSVAAVSDIETPMSGSDYLTWQQNLGRTTTAPPVDEVSDGPSETMPTGLDRGAYRPPSARESVAVVEAAFAGESSSGSGSVGAVLAPASARSSANTSKARGAVASRSDYADVAAAIDAALEDEFGF